MWMWWDHYIYCNFWAHAVVHRVHHTPTRRLESARFIWPRYFFGCPVSVGCQQSGSRISIRGRDPDSRLHAPLARACGPMRARRLGSQESGERDRENRSAKKSGKKTPPCSPRDRTRRAGAELMRRFGTIPCRLDSQFGSNSLLSPLTSAHRASHTTRTAARMAGMPLPTPG